MPDRFESPAVELTTVPRQWPETVGSDKGRRLGRVEDLGRRLWEVQVCHMPNIRSSGSFIARAVQQMPSQSVSFESPQFDPKLIFALAHVNGS